MSAGPVTVTMNVEYGDYWWFAQMSQGVPVINHPVPDVLCIGQKVRRCCDKCEVEWESIELECWSCGELGHAGWISRKNLSEAGVMAYRHEGWVSAINRSCELEADTEVSMPSAEV